MADEMYRRFHSGRYGKEDKKEVREFTTSEEVNAVLTESQKDLEKSTEGNKASKDTQKLRDKSRKTLEDMGL